MNMSLCGNLRFCLLATFDRSDPFKWRHRRKESITRCFSVLVLQLHCDVPGPVDLHLIIALTHVDVVDEGPDEASDTESLGRDSDVASVAFSEISTESVEEPAIRQVANARGFSRGLAQLDGCHLTEIFERRAHVMRVVPHVMRAAFCSAIRAACDEIFSGLSLGDITRQERGWKLFLLLPRMLLCRPRRGWFVPRKDLEQRLALFHGGNWHELVSHSIRMAEQVSQNLVRRGRHHNSDTVEARAVRAEKFV